MNEKKILEVNSLVRANSRTDLIQKCKEKNLSVSGTKHDMAVRLIGGWDADEAKTTSSIPKIIITRNSRGMWEYNGILFDDKTKNAIGYLDVDGKVKPLQREHIEICKRYKFRYNLPDVLDEDVNMIQKASQDEDSDESEEILDEEEDEENESLQF